MNEQHQAGDEIIPIDELDEIISSSILPSSEADGLYEHFSVAADKGQEPLRVDKFLVDRMPRTSRHRIQMAAEAGAIFANGRSVKSNYKVKPGDHISLRLERPRHEFEITAEELPLNIVYEDADLLVVNKPAGMVVHPGNGNYSGTLVNALAFHLKDSPDYDPKDPRLGLVHRIDKDTSGLLVVAKKPEAKTFLAKQFFDKTSLRTYQALVWGRFDEPTGTIEGNIGRKPNDRLVMTVFPPDSPEGKPAITHYTLLEELAFVSLVECRLETGRTHQIRAHMAHIRHPLFADARYGGDAILRGTKTQSYRQFINNCFAICPRQALHAKTLGFRHPTTGEDMLFDSSLPSDIANLIERWRQYTKAITRE